MEFIEHDHRPRNDTPLELVEHGLGRAVEIAIDVNKSGGVRQELEKIVERIVKSTAYQPNIVRDPKRFAGESPNGQTAPGFGETLE